MKVPAIFDPVITITFKGLNMPTRAVNMIESSGVLRAEDQSILSRSGRLVIVKTNQSTPSENMNAVTDAIATIGVAMI